MNELCAEFGLLYALRLHIGKTSPFDIIGLFVNKRHVLTGRLNKVIWQYVPKAGIFQQ